MNSFRQTQGIAALLLASCVVIGFGCNLALGVGEFSTDGCPAPGALQCLERTLQVCNANGQWQTDRECGLDCTKTGCIDCEEGTLQCNSDNTAVLACQPNGLWAEQKCIDQTCVNHRCMGVCAPGTQCVDDTNIQACVNGQWRASGTCPPNKPCRDGVCHECDDGEFRCNGNIVEKCLSSTWYPAQDCSTSGEWGTACVSGQCAGNCSPGKRRCNGTISETCTASGDWQGADCSAQFRTCDPMTGTCGGECIATSSPICVGNVVKSCTTKVQWEYADCGPASTCVAGVCSPVCGPASGRCQGNMAQACDVAGNWKNVSTCANGCLNGTCSRATCDCGLNQGMECCASPVVPGGMYHRSNSDSATAMIGPFRLDDREITVGRFRKFVATYDPSFFNEGMGANPHVLGSGWKAAWNINLSFNAEVLKTNLACHATSTWTDTPGDNEGRPLNCLSWYEAFAFCIWDGGFLPTEAEWNFAAAGGDEQREFPWSVPANNTAIDLDHAVFQCLRPDSFDYNDCILGQLPLTGSRSPVGDGKYGHKDLAGSLYEWTLDVYGVPYPNGNDCQDCANLNEGPESTRVVRGGGWNSTASMLYSHARAQWVPGGRQWFIGARCARGI